MKSYIAFLLLVLLDAPAAARPADYFIARRHVADGKNIPYRLFIPYSYDPGQEYPVMLTLHGGGGNGTDNWYHITYSANVAEAWADTSRQLVNPSFVVSPQIPSGASWGTYNAWNADLLDSLIREFSIDPDRQYVCGISLGGFGTVSILGRYPDRFAAGVPMSSGGGVSTGKALAHIPMWVFHSQNDDVVPVSTSRDLVAGIEEVVYADGEAVIRTHCVEANCTRILPPAVLDSLVSVSGEKHFFTEFVSSGHACQGAAFGIPYLFTWVYSQHLDAVPPNAPEGLVTTDITTSSVSLAWTAPTAAVDGDEAAWYFIYRDGTRIAKVYTASYSDAGLDQGRTYDYQVYASDFMRNLSSAAAESAFTTDLDATPPVVERVIPYSLTETEIVFNKPMAEIASGTAGNYAFSGGVTVSTAERQADRRSVLLTTTAQTDAQSYTITLNGLEDVGGNALAANTQKVFTGLAAFTDDFEAGNYSRWTPSQIAYWTVVTDSGDNSLYMANRDLAGILKLDRHYRTVTVDCDMRAYTGSTERNGTIVFAYRDDDNYYYANIAGANDPGRNGIFRRSGGFETKLAEPAGALLYDREQYHHVRVLADVATGDIKVWVDNSAVLAMSAKDPGLTGGKVGVWSIVRRTYFDNVEITRTRSDAFLSISDAPGLPVNTGFAVRVKVWPSPVRNTTGFTLSGPDETGYTIQLSDQNGQVFRSLNGSGTLRWDGKDRNGKTVKPGIYFYTIDAGSNRLNGKIIKL